MPVKTLGRVLTLGGLWVLLYVVVTPFLPPPPNLVRTLVAGSFVSLPAAAAVLSLWRAGREAMTWERGFWRLLAVSASAQGLAGVLFACQESLSLSSSALRLTAGLANDAQLVLALASLLVRPDRQRGPGETRAVLLEWSMAVVGGGFLVLYVGRLSPRGTPEEWFFPGTLELCVVAVTGLVLAARVRREPFRRVYAVLAGGFVAAGLLCLQFAWIDPRVASRPPGWLTLVWVFPLVAAAGAARLARDPAWVRPSREEGRGRPPWMAPLAVALPPVIHLGVQATGGPPDLSGVRSSLTLACTLILVVLSAIRLHPRAMVLPDVEAREGDRHGPARDSLEFASGVAHELNNPLMAVAGWAEIALKKGAPEAPMRELIEETRIAAEAVARLHQMTRSSKGLGG